MSRLTTKIFRTFEEPKDILTAFLKLSQPWKELGELLAHGVCLWVLWGLHPN
jgi:hypothetical protein